MKYKCDICTYECEYESQWKQHIETIKHINNGIKIRKITRNKKCEICDYEAKNYSAIRNHYLSKHGTKEERKKEYPYYCVNCDSGTYTKCIFTKHCNSIKHKQCVSV